MLERVGLGHRTGHRPNQLSGGEQQRVTIARALAVSAGGLGRRADRQPRHPHTTRSALLHELNREQGQTIVLVTHDPAIGASSAGRVVRMRDGHLTGDDGARWHRWG